MDIESHAFDGAPLCVTSMLWSCIETNVGILRPTYKLNIIYYNTQFQNSRILLTLIWNLLSHLPYRSVVSSATLTTRPCHLLRYSAALSSCSHYHSIVERGFRFNRVIPESVPWLFARNRFEEAKRILHKAARWNKIDLPQKYRPHNTAEGDDPCQECPLVAKKETTSDEVTRQYTILDIFRSLALLRILLVLFYLW